MSEIVLTASNHTISQNRVSVTSLTAVTTYRLPKSASRVSIQTVGKGLSRLVIGGFKTVTVSVVGPTEIIEQLRDQVV